MTADLATFAGASLIWLVPALCAWCVARAWRGDTRTDLQRSADELARRRVWTWQ